MSRKFIECSFLSFYLNFETIRPDICLENLLSVVLVKVAAECQTLLRGVNVCRISHSYCPIEVKSAYTEHQFVLWSNEQFRNNRCKEAPYLPYGHTQYFTRRKLQANIHKTEVILFTRRRPIPPSNSSFPTHWNSVEYTSPISRPSPWFQTSVYETPNLRHT